MDILCWAYTHCPGKHCSTATVTFGTICCMCDCSKNPCNSYCGWVQGIFASELDDIINWEWVGNQLTSFLSQVLCTKCPVEFTHTHTHTHIYSKTCLSWPPTVPEKVVNICKWSTYTNNFRPYSYFISYLIYSRSSISVVLNFYSI
jgi:hypothetical protein